MRAEVQIYSRKNAQLEIIIEQHKVDFSVLNSQASSLKLHHDNFGKLVIGSHEEMRLKYQNHISASLDIKIGSMMVGKSSTVNDADLRQRVTTSTIEYFAQTTEGGVVTFDRNAARQCLSQILTNAYGIPYEEVQTKLNASFDANWNGASKHSDGTLHQEHYQAFFNSALGKMFNGV